MRYRVTMRDGATWTLEITDDATPARMLMHDEPEKAQPYDWIYTANSLMGVGGDIRRLASDLAQWAELEEWTVTEVVPMKSVEAARRVPRFDRDRDFGLYPASGVVEAMAHQGLKEAFQPGGMFANPPVSNAPNAPLYAHGDGIVCKPTRNPEAPAPRTLTLTERHNAIMAQTEIIRKASRRIEKLIRGEN